MKCISCQVEINPQWTHAIDINVCPFCGKHIMDEHLKNLFSSLRETMNNLLNYPDQLDDWMLSNHNYIRTYSEKLINYVSKDILADLKKIKDDRDFLDRKKFTVKVKTENGTIEEVQAESLQSEETTNDFFKRAEVIRPSNPSAPKSPDAAIVFQSPAEKTQHLKEMAKQIKKAGAAGLTVGGQNFLSEEMLENADPEAVAEFQSMISGGEIVSSLPDAGDDDVPAHILAANQAVARAKGSSGGTNAADLLKLQQMQERLQRSKEDFASGANRGGKGGGFSRSG